jgi:Type I restriction modification DNA specificity domain
MAPIEHNEMVKVSDLFDVSYGTKLDFKQMQTTSRSDPDGVCFVSRSSRNLGVVARVKRYKNVSPLPAGAITVALGGTYLLSAFVQEHPFYTAQNVAVLRPKAQMKHDEKLFYCLCLARNRSRYSAFGREANRTLGTIEVPRAVPRWLTTVDRSLERLASMPLSKRELSLNERKWKWFQYDELFRIEKGERIVNNDLLAGPTPCIRPIEINNGIDGHISLEPNHKGNTITVSYNGSIGEAFYQAEPYFAVDDINVLYPMFPMSSFMALFLLPLIRMEKYRYSFGRKWNLTRMRESRIKLPVTTTGEPDWGFMEQYIGSLPYSGALATESRLST